MFPSLNFPLRRIALLVAVAYCPQTHAAQAGRINFTTGEPVVTGTDGRERQLLKGQEVNAGDRILTRAGRAQLAFTDGSFISLQPNTEFAIDEYNFKGKNDGTEKGSFSLLKGALRTITGLIGRGQRDAYSMRTPTATIGIRGTGGQIEVNSRGTLVRGTSGTWFMSTGGGTLDVPAGSTGFAGTDQDTPPTITSGTPNTPPSPSGGSNLNTDFVAGNQRNTDFSSTMTDGPGYSIGLVRWVGDGELQDALTSRNATFSAGKLTGWDNPLVSLGAGSVVDSGNDGLIGWGRWIGTVDTNPQFVYDSDKGAHYVVGLPTAVMPTGGTLTYSLLGGTRPTWSNGTGTGTLNSGSLTVALNGGAPAVNVALNLTIGGATYSLSNSGTLNTAVTGSFNGSLAATSSDMSCSGGCSGSVNGFFTGANAERAGLTYKMDVNMINDRFIGAAAFKKP